LQILAHLLLLVGSELKSFHHRFVIELFDVGLSRFDRLAQGQVIIIHIRRYRLAIHRKIERVIAD